MFDVNPLVMTLYVKDLERQVHACRRVRQDHPDAGERMTHLSAISLLVLLRRAVRTVRAVESADP